MPRELKAGGMDYAQLLEVAEFFVHAACDWLACGLSPSCLGRKGMPLRVGHRTVTSPSGTKYPVKPCNCGQAQGERTGFRRYDHRMRVVGFSCTPRQAYVALAANGSIEKSSIERLDVAAQHEASEELLATRDDVRRIVRELSVNKFVLLMPEEQPRRKPSYQELLPRIALETVIRIAAVEDDVAVELMPRPTVRARLGLPRSGSLNSHVDAAIESPVGRYWNEGRCLAALAALAGGVER